MHNEKIQLFRKDHLALYYVNCIICMGQEFGGFGWFGQGGGGSARATSVRRGHVCPVLGSACSSQLQQTHCRTTLSLADRVLAPWWKCIQGEAKCCLVK